MYVYVVVYVYGFYLKAHEWNSNSLVGHSDRVVSVTTSGTDIITSSLDKTVKIRSLKVSWKS